MNKVNMLKEWNIEGERGGLGYNLKKSIKIEYPTRENSVGWYPIGFDRGNDHAIDIMRWYGFKFSFQIEEEVEIDIVANFVLGESINAKIFLTGKGLKSVDLKLIDFNMERSKGNIWRYLKSVEIKGNAELISASINKGNKIFIESEILGKSGSLNEVVQYNIKVHNCSEDPQYISIDQVFKGWESLLAEVNPKKFILNKDDYKEVSIKVRIHDNMVPGGHENTTLRFLANSDSNTGETITLKTLRRLPHPYIYHNKEQWKERIDLIDNNEKFKSGYDEIINGADNWEVKPPISLNERDYCYDTSEENYIMQTAYAYALTNEKKYANKLVKFFRYFINENDGYPVKKKGCSQSYVQEGHFFQHLAIAYDIIHDEGVLTDKEHRGIEKCFRIYIDILDRHLDNGHISNWLLSEITGGFYCALAIEDIEKALRFVFGNCGAIDHLKYGVFNDGWWYECSVGYNIWVSSLYIHTAHALLPFGYNILNTHFSVPFNDEVHSTYNGEDFKMKFGMYNKKWGGNIKNYICIKDLFDATIPFLDYRGVLFGISDSTERKLEGVHFGSTFDLAYKYYKDPEYIPIINQNEYIDPIFGNECLPKYKSTYIKKNAYSDNIGIAMLRSQTDNREQREQIQAVLRYGSHGYAHGHFDITELLSVMRYGRSFFNPESCWWGYKHFMYKFYVQNSITKNMVVVDEKMQVPADSRRVLFYNGDMIQAVAINVKAKWSYPPYGGMQYDDYKLEETLEERCEFNASYLPKVDNNPNYGELSGYTEEVYQTRVMAVTDDYIVLFDYLKGEEEHQYDSLFQMKGFKGINSENIDFYKHTSQLTENPLSDAQFITDCHWYDVEGCSIAQFESIFDGTEETAWTKDSLNEPGVLKMDVYTAWPTKSKQIIGRVAKYSEGYQIPLEYSIDLDGNTVEDGEFGAWLLGEGKWNIALNNNKNITIKIKNGYALTEQLYPKKTAQALFLGEAYILTKDGKKNNISELNISYENVDHGYGIGKDYMNGRVTIVGNEYPNSIPVSPINHDEEAVIKINIEELEDAVAFIGNIGADAFPGDENQNRKTYSVRTKGKEARYINIIEAFEDKKVIKSVNGINNSCVEVVLNDGRRQVINVNNINNEDITVDIKEYRDEILIREEITK